MTGPMLYIDPIATGDATLGMRAAALRGETDKVLAGDQSAVARGNQIVNGNIVTVNAVANAMRGKTTPPGLVAWRDALGTFLETVRATQKTQALPQVIISEPASISGFKIPGTNVIVPWLAVLAVAGFLGVAWYVTQKRGKR